MSASSSTPINSIDLKSYGIHPKQAEPLEEVLQILTKLKNMKEKNQDFLMTVYYEDLPGYHFLFYGPEDTIINRFCDEFSQLIMDAGFYWTRTDLKSVESAYGIDYVFGIGVEKPHTSLGLRVTFSTTNIPPSTTGPYRLIIFPKCLSGDQKSTSSH